MILVIIPSTQLYYAFRHHHRQLEIFEQLPNLLKSHKQNHSKRTLS
jgi:hypothetical protein